MKSNTFKIFALAMLLVMALPSCRKTVKYHEQQPTDNVSLSEKTDNNENSSQVTIEDDGMPAASSTPVLDMAGVLSDEEIAEITKKTNELYDLELAQTAVLIVNDLNGKDCLDYATAIGKKWGVGRKDINDGITIVIKPKTAQSKGQAAIATGLGMEKILSNDMCRNIINNKMIPLFKENDYGGAINVALDEIKEILTTEQQKQ